MGIIEFIKKIIKVKNGDLSFLNVGDIIWAKRYQTIEEQNKIQKGHQESPYVVIKKTRSNVYALQCTSNPHQEVKWKMIYYPLGRLHYNMNKNTYINCLVVRELKEVQFVEMIGHMSDSDINQLKKHLYILKQSNCKVKPDIEAKYLDFSLGVGDVILYENDRYYIDSVYEKKFEVIKLRKGIKKEKSILLNNTYYSFIFEKEGSLKRKNYELVDTFNSGEVIAINEYKKKYMQELNCGIKNTNTLKVGALIDYNGNMFYVYEEDEKSIFAYRVYSNAIMEKWLATIVINDGMYKTFFEKVKIAKENLKSNGYKIRRCASRDEIEYNAKLFQLPKSERNRKRKELCLDFLTPESDIENIIPMMILKNNNNNKNYLVLNREGNVIEVVNIDDMGDLYCFELEQGNCPFEYYRIVSKEEFEMYLKKVQEFKDMVSMFNR